MAEIRLFSPETYHTLYGGHSPIFGDRIEKFIDSMKVSMVPIDRAGSNVPMVDGCLVSLKEMGKAGPQI
jgi:hypothetical protein